MVVRSKQTDADYRFAIGFKAARLAADLTQEQVTSAMSERDFGFHQATVYKIEKLQRRVTVAEALALAEIVGRSIEQMVSGDNPEVWDAMTQIQLTDRELVDAVHAYVNALWAGAVAADRANDVPDSVRRWFLELLPTQTPARRAALSSPLQLTAAVSREDLDPDGEYLSTLVSMLKHDAELFDEQGDDGEHQATS